MSLLINIKLKQKQVLIFFSAIIIMFSNVAGAISTTVTGKALNICISDPFYSEALHDLIKLTKNKRDDYFLEFNQKKLALIKNQNLVLQKLESFELNKTGDVENLTLSEKETFMILIIEFQRILAEIQLVMQQIEISDELLVHVSSVCSENYANNIRPKLEEQKLETLVLPLKAILAVDLANIGLNRNIKNGSEEQR